MAGDEIVMPENTMMVIHEPRGVGAGTAAEMRVIAEALDRACRSIVSIYAAKTERSAADIEALLAAETWMSAQEAVDLGFADRVVDPVAIAARFDPGKFRANHPPAAAVAMFREVSMSSVAAPQPADPRVEEPGSETPAAPAAEPESTEVLPESKADEAADAPAEPQTAADVSPAPAKVTAEAASLAVEARTVALAYAREVTELCALAGFAERAAGFIKAETTVEQVREALLEARAAADARLAIDGSREPRAGRMPADAGWGDTIARVFKQ